MYALASTDSNLRQKDSNLNQLNNEKAFLLWRISKFGVFFFKSEIKFKKQTGLPLSESFASIHIELFYLTTHESQVKPEGFLLLLSEEDNNIEHGFFFTGTHRHHLN